VCSSNCEQCHVVSLCTKLSSDLLLSVLFFVMTAYAVDGAEGIVFWGCPSVSAYVLACLHTKALSDWLAVDF